MSVHPEISEEAEVYIRRFREALEYGFTRIEARLFAESDLDVGDLRKLKEKGCPPSLAARIIL